VHKDIVLINVPYQIGQRQALEARKTKGDATETEALPVFSLDNSPPKNGGEKP
jgi:hypothetical protein